MTRTDPPTPDRGELAPSNASSATGSGEGGGQQGEGGDDDGDADVVEAVPAVHLLLPVLGPVLGVHVLPRLLIGTSSRSDMITLTISSAAAMTTRPVPG